MFDHLKWFMVRSDLAARRLVAVVVPGLHVLAHGEVLALLEVPTGRHVRRLIKLGNDADP